MKSIFKALTVDRKTPTQRSVNSLRIVILAAVAAFGSGSAFSIPLPASSDVVSVLEDEFGLVSLLDSSYVPLSSGNIASVLGCQYYSATGTACYSGYSTYGAWGSQSSLTNTSPSAIVPGLEGLNMGVTSRDILVLTGVAPGTYSIVPTVTLDGTVSWNNQWREGTVHAAFYEYEADGITYIDNGFYDVSENVFNVTATLLGIIFSAYEPFNFQIGFGQTVRIFRGADDEENTNVEGNFLSTMHITGLEIFDGAGDSVSGWTIESASGARYTASGVSVVPTPATLALFTLGLATLGWSRRKKA